MSRVMFLHEGDVLFGEYHAVNTMDPHVVGSAMLWPTDPGTGEILGQITINTNTDTTGSMTHQDGGNGHYPGGYGGDTGGSNSAVILISSTTTPIITILITTMVLTTIMIPPPMVLVVCWGGRSSVWMRRFTPWCATSPAPRKNSSTPPRAR